jgi:hypothetical protein
MADLACCKDSANLPDNRLIAAQVGHSSKYEAQIVSEVVSWVFTPQFDRKANNPVVPRCAFDQSTTKSAGWDNIFRNVFEIEQDSVR